MKYYRASYNGSLAEGMHYTEHGGEKDLYLFFPELKTIIDRYPLRAIDLRLANGDRLRIYDIGKSDPMSSTRTHLPIPEEWTERPHTKRIIANGVQK